MITINLGQKLTLNPLHGGLGFFASIIDDQKFEGQTLLKSKVTDLTGQQKISISATYPQVMGPLRKRMIKKILSDKQRDKLFSNFSCMFLNPNNFFQFEFQLF